MANLTPDCFKRNVQLLTGFYFDQLVEVDPGVFCATSSRLPDLAWNYAFTDATEITITRTVRLHIREVYSQAAFDPLFVRTPGQDVSFEEMTNPTFSLSAWMTTRKSDLREPSNADGYAFDIGPAERFGPENLATVFDQAYRNGDAKEPGYNTLPDYYTAALKEALLANPDTITAVATDPDGRIVGMATCIGGADCGVVNNVAVAPEHRSRGIGKMVTYLAANALLANGRSHAFLQTQAGSAVERAYKAIGFDTDFVSQATKITQ